MYPSVLTRFAPALYILMFFSGFLSACIWFNPEAYRADIAPALTAFAAVALVWLVWAVVSVRMRARGEMLRREKTVQRENVHPVLHAAIRPVEEKPGMLALVVHNHGKGLAKNVRLQASAVSDHPSAAAVAEALHRLPVFGEGADVLAAGEMYAGIFADVRSLAEGGDGVFGGIVRLDAHYENVFGEPCSARTDLDVSLINHVEVEDVQRIRLMY